MGKPTARIRRLFSRPKSADYLGMGLHTFDHLVATGELRPVELPGLKQRRFDVEDLDRLIETSKTRTVPPIVPAIVPKKARNLADFMSQLDEEPDAIH